MGWLAEPHARWWPRRKSTGDGTAGSEAPRAFLSDDEEGAGEEDADLL
jgi:hypothetical protein